MPTPKLNLQIEYLPLGELRPYDRNARRHGERQIASLVRSIEGAGFVNPVLIDKYNEIIAGHGRVEAAEQAGEPTVPTIRLAHLNPAQVRALRLADNRIALELACIDLFMCGDTEPRTALKLLELHLRPERQYSRTMRRGEL